MLQLSQITKDYVTGDMTVHALKGIDINFRDNEFVSILGPSGCGKTTLLNIIGGLDHYTSGDLVIDGRSTKEFKSRDWDTYRNHRIGFVFQSYNLIPHQTILQNVELALTISGMDKKTRILKAKEALDKVGLSDLYNKRPNQLSGGQCQRVAIARALVNEPDILLADEPTGALDSTTSVQIMELIKEISKDRLVIMVTHNPELAEKYSTRIIKLLDGLVTSDSNSYVPEETVSVRTEQINNVKKSKLSLISAFLLSAQNLRTKLRRSLLVSFAGAIGIIGVSSVLSVSTGVRTYINDMQEDMLSGNPVTVSEESMDLSSLMNLSSTSTQQEAIKENTKDGYVDVDSVIDYLVSRVGDMDSLMITNNIDQNYVDYVLDMDPEFYSAITLDYGINVGNNIYTEFKLESGNDVVSLSGARNIITALLSHTGLGNYSSLISLYSEEFQLAPSNSDFILSQYDIVAGDSLPQEDNELMIVLDSNGQLSDLLLAQFGYFTQDEFFNSVYKAQGDEKYDESLDKTSFSYEELLGKKFIYYPNDLIFKERGGLFYENRPFNYNVYASDIQGEGTELEISCILRPKEEISYGCLSSGVYYNDKFVEKFIQDNYSSAIANYIRDNDQDIHSINTGGQNRGLYYDFHYSFEGTAYDDIGFVGDYNALSEMLSGQSGSAQVYTLTLRDVGGKDTPSRISIYPVDFSTKTYVTTYLTEWNSENDITVNGTVIKAEDRAEITYTDNMELVISMISSMVDMVTVALVAFTVLSLVVSTIMIAIITYVSVIERIKEIGVIRSLGGRKRDVANLFISETFIIGLTSGLIGILVTWILTLIVNAIVNSMFQISAIAILTVPIILIMILISVLLTLISGLIPANMAAHKDPVEALRTE